MLEESVKVEACLMHCLLKKILVLAIKQAFFSGASISC